MKEKYSFVDDASNFFLFDYLLDHRTFRFEKYNSLIKTMIYDIEVCDLSRQFFFNV